MLLNDYKAIEELRKWKSDFELDKPALEETLNRLGDEASQHLESVLQEAVVSHSNVIALTHVPPFKEATWHEGKISDDNFLSHFSCKATGDVFRNVMASHSRSQLLVLCGHTHGEGEVQITDNIHVLTGGAEYGQPVIQRILDIE